MQLTDSTSESYPGFYNWNDAEIELLMCTIKVYGTVRVIYTFG